MIRYKRKPLLNIGYTTILLIGGYVALKARIPGIALLFVLVVFIVKYVLWRKSRKRNKDRAV